MPITLEQARDLLKRAVETQGPKFIYNPDGMYECRYEPVPDCSGPPGQTGCLVGVALELAGETRQRGYKDNVLGLTHKFPDMMTEQAAVYFLEAQSAQDGGTTWGEAYARAEESLSGWMDE